MGRLNFTAAGLRAHRACRRLSAAACRTGHSQFHRIIPHALCAVTLASVTLAALTQPAFAQALFSNGFGATTVEHGDVRQSGCHIFSVSCGEEPFFTYDGFIVTWFDQQGVFQDAWEYRAAIASVHEPDHLDHIKARLLSFSGRNYVAGSYHQFIDPTTRNWISLFYTSQTTGTLIKSVRFRAPADDTRLGDISLASGGIIVSGAGMGWDGSGHDMFAMHFKNNLAYKWGRAITSSSDVVSSDVVRYGFAFGLGSGYLLAGRSASPDGLVFASLDQSGTLNFAKRVDMVIDDIVEIEAIGVVGDEGFILMFTSGGKGNLLKVDPTGNLLWMRDYTIGTGGTQSFTGITALPGGDVAVSGFISGVDAFVLRVDQTDGSPLWARTVGDPARRVSDASDGRIVTASAGNLTLTTLDAAAGAACSGALTTVSSNTSTPTIDPWSASTVNIGSGQVLDGTVAPQGYPNGSESALCSSGTTTCDVSNYATTINGVLVFPSGSNPALSIDVRSEYDNIVSASPHRWQFAIALPSTWSVDSVKVFDTNGAPFMIGKVPVTFMPDTCVGSGPCEVDENYPAPAGYAWVPFVSDTLPQIPGSGTMEFEVRVATNSAGGSSHGMPVVAWSSFDTDALEGTIVEDGYLFTYMPDCACTEGWVRRNDMAPSARSGHGSAYDQSRNQLVVFGGFDGTDRLNDTWVWDGTTWSERFPATSPSARNGQGMVYDPVNRRVIMHGGFDELLGANSPETWAWDGATWTLLGNTGPEVRSFGMAYDPVNANVVMYGGTTNSGRADNTWKFDGSSWSIADASSPPGARSGHAMVYDATAGLVHMFGGQLPLGVETNDNWTYDGTTWTDLGASGPSARHHHRMTHQDGCGTTLLYGGTKDGTFYDDVWEWNGSAWSLLEGSAAPGQAASMSFDFIPLQQSYILFGGDDAGGRLGTTWQYTCLTVLDTPPVDARPSVAELSAGVPNPFTSSTLIRYTLSTATPVTLRIVDVGGRLVRELQRTDWLAPGRYNVTWNGRDEVGRLVSPGVYFSQLIIRGEVLSRRVLVLR